MSEEYPQRKIFTCSKGHRTPFPVSFNHAESGPLCSVCISDYLRANFPMIATEEYER